ncbi:MAG: ABC transporter ATP-binding protein [Planctomycetaceae bacterium]
MIRAESLRKSYDGLTAVDGVSFEVRPGETFGLLGPNGAGKTTTIPMLVGALRPDAGSIEVAGAPDPSRAEVRRAIGLAPQSLSLYGELTGEENLLFFARLHGLRGARLRERVAWALEFAGLRERAGQRVSAYSGGMQRRLNLACALVHEPSVLFLDEPTAGVDPQSRNHLFANIEVLAREGRTILYTTHYMEEAERLCDRVAILDRGRILDCDTVHGLLSRHGGRAVIEAQLAEPLPEGVLLPGRIERGMLRVETERPLEDLARVASAGAKLSSLHLHQPDLETVFLTLTGRSLRDA